eukprot:6191647-Pleurochrysis_carterae.AAC.1
MAGVVKFVSVQVGPSRGQTNMLIVHRNFEVNPRKPGVDQFGKNNSTVLFLDYPSLKCNKWWAQTTWYKCLATKCHAARCDASSGASAVPPRRP